MYSTAHLNIAMESFGLLVSVVLFILLMTGGDRNNKLDRLFARLVLINILMLASDLLSWIAEGNTSAYSVTVMRVAVFSAYFIPFFFMVALYYYIVELIGEKTDIPRIFLRMLYLLIGVNTALIVISQLNGMIYYIDRDNTYIVGEFFVLYQIISLAFALVLQAVIWRYRKKMKTGEMLFLSSYIMVLFVSAVFQLLFFTELELVFVGTTLCVLLMYGGIQMRRQKERELELAESRIAVMLSQIRPHFLYNSLASISNMCKANPEAKEALLTFSEYLRGNMNSLSQTQPIPFETELAHIKHYLWLEQMRYGEKLQVQYDIETTDFLLPTLSVQPIVENAVQHGLFGKGTGGTVAVRTEEADGCYRVVVTDNGVGFDPAAAPDDRRCAGSPALHVGIENVRSRLDTMCGGTLMIQSSPGEGTTAIIEIPKGERI